MVRQCLPYCRLNNLLINSNRFVRGIEMIFVRQVRHGSVCAEPLNSRENRFSSGEKLRLAGEEFICVLFVLNGQLNIPPIAGKLSAIVFNVKFRLTVSGNSDIRGRIRADVHSAPCKIYGTANSLLDKDERMRAPGTNGSVNLFQSAAVIIINYVIGM